VWKNGYQWNVTSAACDFSNLSLYQLLIYMKKLDLTVAIEYDSRVRGTTLLTNSIRKGLPTMKLAIRIFALCVFVAGAAAASVSSASTATFQSHQSASSSLPVPTCGPHLPTCPPPGSGN
jgi:hypothetical protein